MIYNNIKNIKNNSLLYYTIYIPHLPIKKELQKAGLYHLFEHMLLKNLICYQNKSLTDNLDEMGARYNGLTDHNCICIYFSVLKEYEFKAEQMLDSIYQLKGYFNTEKLSNELNLIKKEIDSRNSSLHFIIRDSFIKQLFSETQYDFNEVGDENLISTIPINDLNFYYESVINNYSDILKIKKDNLFVFKNRKINLNQIKIKNQMKKKVFRVQMSVENINPGHHLMLGFFQPLTKLLDFLYFQIFHYFLGKGFSSCLYRKVRDQKYFLYHIETNLEIFDSGVVFYIYAHNSKRINENMIHKIIQIIKNDWKYLNEEKLKQIKQKIFHDILIKNEKNMLFGYYYFLNNQINYLEPNINQLYTELISISLKDILSFINEKISINKISYLLI